MTTLAIDPAATTGLAVVQGAALLHSHVIRARMTATERLALLQSLPRPDRIAIERPQLRTVDASRESQGKAQSTLAVSKAVGTWITLVQLAYPGTPILHVYPATWRSVLRMPPADRKTLKARSLAAAKKRWPDVTWETDDQSDAALLGLAVETNPEMSK